MTSNLSVRVYAVSKQYIHNKHCVRMNILMKNKSRPFKHVALLFHIVADSNCRCGFEGIWYQYCIYWQGVMKYVERCLSPSRGRDVATDVKQPSHRELRGEREREREGRNGREDGSILYRIILKVFTTEKLQINRNLIASPSVLIKIPSFEEMGPAIFAVINTS